MDRRAVGRLQRATFVSSGAPAVTLDVERGGSLFVFRLFDARSSTAIELLATPSDARDLSQWIANELIRLERGE